MTENQKCVSCANQISWIGLWDSLALALFKGIVGTLTHSRALMASALYSVHDVISGLAIIIGIKVAARPADDEHPYGHGNAEYIVSAFTSILILVAAIFIMADSVKVLFRNEHSPSHWAALGVALLSVFANEIIYRYNKCSVKQLNSPALMAHAKHHRADVIASLAVAVAILGSKMGLRFLDPMVAVFETGHLLLLSAEILYHGGAGLMDCSINESDVSQIRRLVFDITEVKEVKNIRTRQIGRYVWVDLYVRLSTKKTVLEAQEISNEIRQCLEINISYLGNVNVICV